MALFKRPSKAPQAPQAPQPPQAAKEQRTGPPTDPMAGDAAAYHFRAELAEGRWQEFHDFLETTRDWDSHSRNFYIVRLASIDGRPDWLDEWAAARPQSALPYLFRGSHGVKWAWEARGSGRASTVGQDAWPVFYARLVDADRDLARAAAMDDADPNPHAQSITVAMGLNLGQAEKRRRFNEAIRRYRWHRGAHVEMIQALAAKWSGSNEEMFEFARSASAQAPDGHSVHVVIPLAHLEKWLNLPRESDDGKARQQEYFRGGAVAADILRAADQSIRSPRYQLSRFTLSDRNIFAMCFWLMKDYRAQLEQMRQIGPLIQASPWHYQGNPGWAYERARTRALTAMQGAGAGAWPPPAS
ncbi:MAG: hypothetical protein ABSA53_19115 [Streptosporangiaceae bacterium]